MTTTVHNPKAEFLMRVCDELPENPTIVEIGCARTSEEDPTDGWSTVYLGKRAGVLHSVDIDQRAMTNARALFDKHCPGGKMYPHFGLDGTAALAAWNVGVWGYIHLLFLDGSDDPRETFQQAMAAESKIAKDGFIVIDDVNPIGENWWGKGRDAIPFLIQQGWKCLIEQTLLQGAGCWAMAKLWR